MTTNARKGRNEDVLDRALRAWRSEPAKPERVSAAGRDRILGEAVRGAASETGMPGSALFPTWRRLSTALVAVAPVVIAAVAVVLVDRPRNPVEPSPARVEVTKVGDRVVFSIANGGRSHVVTRSDSPDRFDPSDSVLVTDGSFEDRVDADRRLVFYKID